MRSFMARAASGSILVCVACIGVRSTRGDPPRVAPGLALAPPPVRDDGRLPATALPERYRLDLRIDPTKPRFSGRATVLVHLPEPTSFIVLNARDLHVAHAEVTVGTQTSVADAALRPAYGSTEDGELVLTMAHPLPAGEAELRIDYDAPFAGDLAGLYRATEGQQSYAYTQFEATDARRAFPCFDEPGFKTPYEISITAPRGLTALSNAPESDRTDTPDGNVLHRFEPTPPLPSYLVAFAVGDFDIVEGQKDPFPIRVVTTKGRGPLAGTALDVAAALIAELGDYFGLRYPYAKLDLVAVPDFEAGAMENPGLVTFRDSLLLLDPAHATTAVKRTQAEVIAHEFAHQWFGDLVTMRWWDDLWLNEGFATWAEGRMVDAWKPSFGATAEQVVGLETVMDTDALRSARRVREPVRSTGQAMEAFDGITYDKGAAVLRMLEQWLGEETFRRGIQRYLHENAWKNAGATDLFAALDYVSAQHVAQLAGAFLDQAGVPEIFSTWTCNGSEAGKLALTESEWRPLGEPPRDPPRTWTIPVCVTTEAQKATTCVTLGADPLVRSLGGRCPAWLYPNASLAGYYRFALDSAQLLTLSGARGSLSHIDRLGLLANAWASVRSGALQPGPLLEALGAFDTEKDRLVVGEIIDILEGLDHSLVSDAARSAFEKFAADRLLPRKRALGWEPARAAHEDDDRALMRHSVLWATAELARDEGTLAEAEAYAERWLKDPNSVSGDTAATAVPLASIPANDARLLELRIAAKAAPTPENRIIALRAMGMFDDVTVLRHAWDLALSDEVKISELRYLFAGARTRDRTAHALYDWEKDNWPKLRARLVGSLAGGLAEVTANMCTQETLDAARAFFGPRVGEIDGAKRPFDEAVETAELCVALRGHAESYVTSWLSARASR
jgi:alanyl aminopeptidase